METVYVGPIMINLLGFLFSLTLNELEHFIIPWKAERLSLVIRWVNFIGRRQGPDGTGFPDLSGFT